MSKKLVTRRSDVIGSNIPRGTTPGGMAGNRKSKCRKRVSDAAVKHAAIAALAKRGVGQSPDSMIDAQGGLSR